MAEEIELIRGLNATTERDVGLYVEVKSHPDQVVAFLAEHGESAVSEQ